MRLNVLTVCWTIASLIVAATAALAAEPPVRAIKVSAMYEMEVVPDEVVLSLAVGTEDSKSPLAAKTENDSRMRAILATIRNRKIDDKYVKIDCLQIHPVYNDEHKRDLCKYVVDRGIDVTLRDFDLLDPILSDALRLGANKVNGILYRTTKHEEYQKKARRLAVAYAKEKASHLAELNGLTLGKAIAIEEDVEGDNHVGGGGGMFSVTDSPIPAANVLEDEVVVAGKGEDHQEKGKKTDKGENKKKDVPAPATPDARQTVAPGTITISATVTITFELK